MHSIYYRTVKRYFEKGCYTAEDVTAFVKAGNITKEEYREITGLDFTE